MTENQNSTNQKEYKSLILNLTKRIKTARQKAVLSANYELILLHWQIGREILLQQKKQSWGSKVIGQVAKDLKKNLPEMKGFSRSNLMYMRSFAKGWPEFESDTIVQQLVGQLPWGHNVVLLNKLKDKEARLFYAHKTIENGWSRDILVIQVENKLIEREGQFTTNFKQLMLKEESEMTQQTLKDPYIFDFFTLHDDAVERDVETALVKHISDFLLELGEGFAYLGQQVHIEVGNDDFYLDLLFYHTKLHRYVVIELKTGAFKPEHIGQLNFYLSAVDSQIKNDKDGASIGLLLCKTKNKIVAEYSLRDTIKPIGISEYKLNSQLPEELEGNLPTIQQIEYELRDSLKGLD